MLRSLFTGISGLRSHQMMMDVTGNNIANVNTTGFKSSAVTFQDTYSQLLEAATQPQAPGETARGGTNPSQVGLGVRVAGMNTNFGQGATQMTGRSTDMMIDGEGLFVVQSAGELMYTRAGSFSLDANGRLVTTEGAPVKGFMAGGTAPGALANPAPAELDDIVFAPKNDDGDDLTGFRIDSNGGIIGLYRDPATGAVAQQPIGQLALATVTNTGGLEKAGNSLYRSSQNSGAVTVNAPGQGANGTISTGALEMSNVDLASEFTNLIISQRGFQANSRVITTSDELLQELVNLKR